MEKMTKQILYKFILFLLGFLLCLVLVKKCSKEVEQVKPLQKNYDSLEIVANNQLKTIELYKYKADSLSTVKAKIVIKYKSLHDTIVKYYQHDSIIVQYVAYCDSLNSVNDSIIAKKDSIILNYESVVKTKDLMLINRNEVIDLHIKSEKKAKQKTVIVGIIGSIVVGALLINR
jgi:hypothetical protein